MSTPTAQALSDLTAWLKHHPEITAEQRVEIDVLRANLADYDRIKKPAARRLLATLVDRVERVCRSS